MRRTSWRFAILILLLFVGASFCGTIGFAFSNEQEAVAEARALYEELLSFKGSKQFADMGFGAGNPQTHAWMKKAERMSNELENTDFSIMLKIAPGDMIQLGLAYLKTGGAENDFTRNRREELEETLY